jgi:hypothetical protein
MKRHLKIDRNGIPLASLLAKACRYGLVSRI